MRCDAAVRWGCRGVVVLWYCPPFVCDTVILRIICVCTTPRVTLHSPMDSILTCRTAMRCDSGMKLHC
ncbi:hypothetical protein DL95DRAFT_393432, partial [Leptodontidium sp. 2 PMI_412]